MTHASDNAISAAADTGAFVVPPRVLFQKVHDEVVLLDLEAGDYFGLNPVGAHVWRLLGRGMDLDAIVDALYERYDTPRERLAADVQALVEELLDRGLLRAAA